MLKRIIPLVLSSVLLLGSVCSLGCLTTAADEAADSGEEVRTRYNYGLHVESDGTITLEGKPFWGFGLNYFGAFCHYEGGSLSYDDMKGAFPQIAAHNIPFVRLPLGGFYPDYYDRFYADPEAALAKMEQVLDAAAESRVGVIVSLLWWDASLPEYAGEQRAMMGDVNSETMRIAKDYVTTVVSRFVNHPAVWGWEIGNEYNLNADLCDSTFKNYVPGEGTPGFLPRERNGYDYYTSDEMNIFFTELSATIRSIDGYRLISSGNSEMRVSSWHMRKSSRRANKKHVWNIDWTMDNKQQFQEIVGYLTPGDTDTVSFHLQFGTSSGEPAYVLTADRAGKYGMPVADYFKLYKETADSLGKGVFFGEFGDFYAMDTAPDMPEKSREIAGWDTDAGIQIGALWQYQDFSDTGAGALKYDVLADLNASFREQGLQDMETPWGAHEAITEVVTGVATEPAETPTEEATEAPAASETDTAAPVTEPETLPDKGCASVVSAAAAVLLCVGAVLTLFVRKKHI